MVGNRFVNANRFSELPALTVTVDSINRQLAKIFDGHLKAKGQRLVLAGGGDINFLAVSSILVDSILGNLLRNAIKFSPPGSDIEFSAAAEGDLIRLSIRDHGGGFPPDLMARGAGRAKATSVGTRGERGTGIGLDVVAFFMRKLGGRVELMNLPGGGAVSSVLLPRGPSEAQGRG